MSASVAFKDFNKANAIFLCQLNGKGGMVELDDKSQISSANPAWLGLDYENENSKQWLKNTDLLPDEAKEALSGESNRPRMARIGNGVLFIFNSINTEADERPDQLVTLRVYMTDSFIISTQHRKVSAVDNLRSDLANGLGPDDSSSWLLQIADDLTDQVDDFIGELHGQIIEMEDNVLDQDLPEEGKMPLLRKQLIILRRYFTPQREIFSRLCSERQGMITDDDHLEMQAVTDRLGRGLEDLDACIARMVVIADEINSIMTGAMNRRIYMMSILAIIFLPATLLTGIFGTSLTGTPGTDAASEMAFSIFCIVIVAMVIGIIVWLKRSKWL